MASSAQNASTRSKAAKQAKQQPPTNSPTKPSQAPPPPKGAIHPSTLRATFGQDSTTDLPFIRLSNISGSLYIDTSEGITCNADGSKSVFAYDSVHKKQYTIRTGRSVSVPSTTTPGTWFSRHLYEISRGGKSSMFVSNRKLIPWLYAVTTLSRPAARDLDDILA
jgi:hypothetical protein